MYPHYGLSKMAPASLLAALLRRRRARNSVIGGDFWALLPFPLPQNTRPFSLGSQAPAIEGKPFPLPAPDVDLRTRIFRLRFPKRSATTALEVWVSEGRKVNAAALRQLVRDLKRSQRYKHALEILNWMEDEGGFQMSAPDNATRLDLITKVHGLSEAEMFFKNISDSTSWKAAAFPLLHYYVKERDLEKAEAVMEKLQHSGLTVDPHPFNEMMKLYMAIGQYEKVLDVIRYMKRGMITCNVLSYNLWMNACSEVSGVASVEVVHRDMVNDKNVEVGWSTYCTLANIYKKYGLIDKAFAALRKAEEKLSLKKRLGYSFILTCYSALNDRDGVLRVWEASKRVGERITCANYMCVILCLLKVGDIMEAEKVFRSWESEFRKYDIRVSNILLGAYMRNGWMSKAETLHLHTLERGGSPNYKTWEILMEGWVRSKQMDKAVEAMKEAFSMLRSCEWRPPSAIIMAIAEYFAEQGRAEDAKKFVKVLSRFHLMSLPLYKLFARAYMNANIEAPDILKMMERDKIELDEEISALIRHVRKVSTNV